VGNGRKQQHVLNFGSASCSGQFNPGKELHYSKGRRLRAGIFATDSKKTSVPF
jgi:hypothetical protein